MLARYLEGGGNLPVGNDAVDGLGDAVGVVVETEVAEQHGAGQEQGGGVGLVLALDVKADVPAAGLEDGDVPSIQVCRGS